MSTRDNDCSHSASVIKPATGDDDLLSRDDIERETKGGITRRWLELAAHRGEGPPMLKISRRMVRYRRGEFRKWLDAQRVAQPGAGE